MFLGSSLSHCHQHRAAIDALKTLLLYESDTDKTDLLSLLDQLNIETHSIECHDQNSVSSSVSCTNYNNSSVPVETDHLSALYAHDQIDPQLCLPPTEQPSFYLCHSHLYSSRLENDSLSEQRRISSNNSSRKSQSRKRKQKQFRSKRNRTKEKNKSPENGSFHYRNMITVRRISCHNILDPQMRIMRSEFEHKQNQFDNEKRKIERNQTRLDTLRENKSQKYQTSSTRFKSSPPVVKLHTSSTPSTPNKSIVSPSTTYSYQKMLTTPICNTLFHQRDVKEKLSNTLDITRSKVTSLRDSSVSSLVPTQLLATAYDQTKPDVTIVTSTASGSQNDSESLDDHLPHLPSTTSVVPHFSSTIVPDVSYISSSTIAVPNTPKNASVLVPSLSQENIQDLVDQLKTCIDMLHLLLPNKTEHKKLPIPNGKSYLDQKPISRKKQQSPSDHSRLSETSISDKNNLIFEDITVRQCDLSLNQIRKRYQNHIPPTYNDRHGELKRCLLVYCRNRNINSNEMQSNSQYIWDHSASKSQSSQSLLNNNKDTLSISRSTLILAEEDDDVEYESLNKLLRESSL